MKQQCPSLFLQPQASKCLVFFLLSLHALGVLSVAISNIHWAAKIFLILLIGGILLRNWKIHIAQTHERAVTTAIWSAQAHWQITNGSGQKFECVNWQFSACFSHLVIIVFTLEKGNKLSLILCQDSLDAEIFRQLRVAARAGRGKEVSL